MQLSFNFGPMGRFFMFALPVMPAVELTLHRHGACLPACVECNAEAGYLDDSRER